jgi:hypothetical protein
VTATTSILKRSAAALAIIVLAGLALRNLVLLSKDMLLGDGSAGELVPSALYPPKRLPETEVTRAHRADGRLGADFAQVYFPAQDASQIGNAYLEERTLDPWSRPSRYAPLVTLACAWSICRLPFGPATLLHLIFQLAVFTASFYWACRVWHLRRWVRPSILLSIACCFVTPVGLSWFERGQFSLYSASAYLLLILGLIERKWVPIALAAVAAYIKWTSLPTAAVILAVYILGSRGREQWIQRAFLGAVFGVVFALLLLGPALFVTGHSAFLSGLLRQELLDNPTGLSLSKLMPAVAVKLVPVLLVVAGFINLCTNQWRLENLAPFFMGAGALLVLYPTRAYDYSMPSLLGFIPAALLWASKPPFHRGIGPAALAAAAAFLIVAGFISSAGNTRMPTIRLYVLFSLAFVALPSLLKLPGNVKQPLATGR